MVSMPISMEFDQMLLRVQDTRSVVAEMQMHLAKTLLLFMLQCIVFIKCHSKEVCLYTETFISAFPLVPLPFSPPPPPFSFLSLSIWYISSVLLLLFPLEWHHFMCLDVYAERKQKKIGWCKHCLCRVL